jgi:hypothetical protein
VEEIRPPARESPLEGCWVLDELAANSVRRLAGCLTSWRRTRCGGLRLASWRQTWVALGGWRVADGKLGYALGAVWLLNSGTALGAAVELGYDTRCGWRVAGEVALAPGDWRAAAGERRLAKWRLATGEVAGGWRPRVFGEVGLATGEVAGDCRPAKWRLGFSAVVRWWLARALLPGCLRCAADRRYRSNM